MKRSLIFLLVFVVLISFTCCKTILLKSKGIGKPRFESRESIFSYLSNNSFDCGSGLFIVKDSTRFFQLSNIVKDFPSVDFFNSKGALLEYSKAGDCSRKAEIFAAGLPFDSVCKIDSSYRFNDVKEKVISADGRTELSLSDADFTLLIYWSVYLGNMNKSVMNVMRTLENNKKIKTKVYLINMDFQHEWGMQAIPEIFVQ